MSVGTDDALLLLDVQRPQLIKLLGTGLLEDVRVPGARRRQLDPAAAADLGSWPHFSAPAAETSLSVHLRPPRKAEDQIFRPMAGYHSANPDDLTERQLELAWVCWWPLTADEAKATIGGLLFGDISGFIPYGLGRRVTGFTQNTHGRVRFLVEPLTDAETEMYTRTRIRALPGHIWQVL